MTHQRQFLPYCDRILVLKHGTQKALGTYSELASSALTELTQLQDETEIDDAIYDQQLPSANPQAQIDQSLGTHAQSNPSSAQHPQNDRHQNPSADYSNHLSQSGLQGAEAGPVQATIEAEVPTAVAAAAEVADSATTTPNCIEQPNHSLLTTQQPDNATGMTTTASTLGEVQSSQHQALRDKPNKAMQQKAAAFTPAVVKRKKYVLPPAVDNRWGPEQRCSRLWHKLRGSGNPQTAGDDVESDAGAEEQAQLNQQEGRATGTF